MVDTDKVVIIKQTGELGVVVQGYYNFPGMVCVFDGKYVALCKTFDVIKLGKL